jgi:hypothetical protein
MPKKNLMPLLNEMQRAPLVRTDGLPLAWKWGHSIEQILLASVIGAGACLLAGWVIWLRVHGEI